MDKPLIGQQIGRYQLLDIIGQGGMGVVYRAIDASIGRTVAIKMLHGTSAEDKDLLARFHREVRFTANLQHKNIVTVYALDDFEGFPYMVMEYLEGESMADIISSRRPLHLVEKIGLVCQICDGLQYAHERNVIHRDIKPANVLVLRDGVAKIVDFGIARVERGETLTRTGQIIGSMYYMSPEQISGSTVDARTDIYSAGVMLYQFLTGELPFKAADADAKATFFKILNDPVPSLGKYLAEYPRALDEILGKAMEKAADARYQTAEDFGYELSRLQEILKRGMTEEFLSQAKVAIDRKEWELARQQLQEVLRVDRRNSKANEWFQIVRQEIQRQQKSVQIAHLRSQAQIALAGLQYEEALECVQQARRLDPNDDELVALSRSIEEQIERAKQLTEALRRGQAALYAGDLNEAERAVQQAIEIEHNHTEARALESLIKKELEERTRRAQFQGFVEDARREISNRNFLSALHSLQRAQAIDPADSNIRELLSWAARGHEQEKLRNELQNCSNKIGQLLGEDRYAEALQASQEALDRFPEESSLLKLHQLAKRQCELIARRRAVDEASVGARRLVDADRSDEAIAILEQALRSFPNDPNLETLLTITRAESERNRQENEERERQQEDFLAEQRLAGAAIQAREGILELLNTFHEGLARKLPISKLRALAEPLADAVKNEQLNTQEAAQYSASLAEFRLRSTKWDRDCKELEELGRTLRDAKGSAEIGSLVDRARFISEQHEKDEEVRGRYQEIRKFAEELKLKREAVSAKVSDLLRSMQASQDLAVLSKMEKQVQELCAFWLEDAFIRSLVNQVATHIEEVRQNKEHLLQELTHLNESLSTARSAGQIKLIEEQAKMLSADCSDADVAKAIGNLQGIARNRLERLDRTISQLKDLAAKVAAAQSMTEVENCAAATQELASGDSDSEEASDLIRRIHHSVDEKKKEYRRIWASLEQLLESTAKATGHAELDLIQARRRDLLKKYPEDSYFRELETRLEVSVSERRSYLLETAPSEDEESTDFDESTELNAINVSVGGHGPQITVPAEELAGTSGQVRPKPRNRLLRFAIPAGGFAVIAGVAAILAAPKIVTVQTIPGGADIAVDGQPCGNPCTLKLRPGQHVLLAKQSGFENLHQTITVPWFGDGLPAFAMSKLPKQPPTPTPPTESKAIVTDDARISVRTSVPDALVFVDDSQAPIGKTGKNGKFQFPTTAGSHRVRVEKSGFESSPVQTITVGKNGQAVASFDVKRPSGLQFPNQEVAAKPPNQEVSVKPVGIVAKSDTSPASTAAPAPAIDTFIVVQAPVGSEIHVDQQPVGHSTGGPLKSKVQPGQRTVEVFLSGFQPYSRTVSVAPGAQENVIADLKPVPAPSMPPNPSLSRTTSAVTDDDRREIQQLLDRYADGYNQRNVKSIQAIWPSIHPDQVKVIKEFFNDSKSVSMKLRLTDASPAGKRVTVECIQTLLYSQGGKEKSQTAAITLYVVRHENGWVIDFIPNS